MADVRIVGQRTPGVLAAADQAHGFGGEKNLFAVPVIFAAQDGEGDFFFAKHLVELAALLGRDMHLYFGIAVCVVFLLLCLHSHHDIFFRALQSTESDR